MNKRRMTEIKAIIADIHVSHGRPRVIRNDKKAIFNTPEGGSHGHVAQNRYRAYIPCTQISLLLCRRELVKMSG
jgi:hypothetical protein